MIVQHNRDSSQIVSSSHGLEELQHHFRVGPIGQPVKEAIPAHGSMNREVDALLLGKGEPEASPPLPDFGSFCPQVGTGLVVIVYGSADLQPLHQQPYEVEPVVPKHLRRPIGS